METREERAERLAQVAVELVGRVHDYPPEENGRWLLNTVGPDDWMGLSIVLACAVPLDVPWSHLTRWVTLPTPGRQLRPCGTRAAAERHRAHGEQLCADCRTAERDRDRVRKRSERAA